MDPIWEALNLTPSRLYIGHPELLVWRYVDTNVKDDPLHGWYNLMNSINSNIILIASTLIKCLSKHPFFKIAVDYGISRGTSELTTSSLFLHVKKT